MPPSDAARVPIYMGACLQRVPLSQRQVFSPSGVSVCGDSLFHSPLLLHSVGQGRWMSARVCVCVCGPPFYDTFVAIILDFCCFPVRGKCHWLLFSFFLQFVQSFC